MARKKYPMSGGASTLEKPEAGRGVLQDGVGMTGACKDAMWRERQVGLRRAADIRFLPE